MVWYGRIGRLAILHKELWDPGVRVEQLHALWGLGTGAQPASPEYGGGVGTFLSIAPDARPSDLRDFGSAFPHSLAGENFTSPTKLPLARCSPICRNKLLMNSFAFGSILHFAIFAANRAISSSPASTNPRFIPKLFPFYFWQNPILNALS